MRFNVTTLNEKLQNYTKDDNYLRDLQNFSDNLEDELRSFKLKQMKIFNEMAKEEDGLS